VAVHLLNRVSYNECISLWFTLTLLWIKLDCSTIASLLWLFLWQCLVPELYWYWRVRLTWTGQVHDAVECRALSTSHLDT
jgi:hypothetical protein